MRIFAVALLGFSLSAGMAHADYIDLETNLSVRELAAIENDLEERYGIVDLASFLAKKASIEASIDSFHRLSLQSGMRMMDMGTGEEVTSILARELQALIADYSLIRPNWRTEVLAQEEAEAEEASEQVAESDEELLIEEAPVTATTVALPIIKGHWVMEPGY